MSQETAGTLKLSIANNGAGGDEDQKRFFELNPDRLATRLFRNPQYPRTLRKKLTAISTLLNNCERVLEIGADRGLQLSFFLSYMPRLATYAGIDVTRTPLKEARTHVPPNRSHQVLLATASAETLPFPADTFDGAFCIDVLHHVNSQPAILAELRRVLRPGGVVVCMEPNPLFPVNLVYWRDPIEKRLFEFTRSRATAWATGAGFDRVRVTGLPVFFPSFPAIAGKLYDRCESCLGAIPGMLWLSTTRVLIARC